MGHRSDPERVKLMMRELQSVLCLEFPSCDGPSVLSEAMNSAQTDDDFTGRNHKNSKNSRLALIGDAFLGLVIAEELFGRGFSKGHITREKAKLVSNRTQKNVLDAWGLSRYYMNDQGFLGDEGIETPATSSDHITYLEAIIGTVYLYNGYDYAKRWVADVVIPGLEKHSVQ